MEDVTAPQKNDSFYLSFLTHFFYHRYFVDRIWMTRKYLDSDAFVGMDTIDMAAKNYGYPLNINDDTLVDPATALLSQRLR